MRVTKESGALSIVAAAALSIGAATSAGTAGAKLSDATVQRAGDRLLVTWKDDEAVNVYVAESPAASSQQRRLVSAKDADGRHQLPADAAARQYIYLEPISGGGLWAGERVLALQGGFNFRDLGGYPTQDGRHVRWGKIYRSGTMVGLTDRDYDYLNRLGIKVVCDFRSAEERLHEPTRWMQRDPSLQYKTKDYETASMGMQRYQGMTAAAAREEFLKFYRFGSLEFKDQYTTMFDELVQGHAPLTFNCSAGKDRTGRAAALILAALGVPDEKIIEDYALTEKVADFRKREQQAAAQGDKAPRLTSTNGLSDEVLGVLMRSDPEYIAAMLDQMKRDYGSAVGFVQKELGVSDAELKKLRELYLEG